MWERYGWVQRYPTKQCADKGGLNVLQSEITVKHFFDIPISEKVCGIK